MFIVSDGKPTTGEVLGLVRRLQGARKSTPVVINTVGIGADQDAELLCQLARENGGVYVRDDAIACASSPCGTDQPIVTSYPPGTGHHQYPVVTAICSLATSGCSAQLVYDTLISEARFQAPTRERTKLTDCLDLDLRIFDWWSWTRPGDKTLAAVGVGPDPVTVVLDPAAFSATTPDRIISSTQAR